MPQDKTVAGRTDYANDAELRESSRHVMDIEAGFTKHYEAQRFLVLNLIVLITGAALALGLTEKVQANVAGALPWALLTLALIGFFVVKRLSQARWFHYSLHRKARKTLFRGHPKLMQQFKEVEEGYAGKTAIWRSIGQERMWELVALIAPVAAALYLWRLPA